jgi:hypothetical protein
MLAAMRLAVLAGSLLSLAAGGASAAPAPAQPAAPPAAAAAGNTVSPLTVFPTTDPPKVVSSWPAAGATVAWGVMVVRVTFDQPMAENSFDLAAGADGAAPKCLKTPRRLNDEKSFVLLCTTAPNSRYSLALNGGAKGGFANLGGTRAAPSDLAFATNGTEGPRDLQDAMKAAKLGGDDGPIREGMYF